MKRHILTLLTICIIFPLYSQEEAPKQKNQFKTLFSSNNPDKKTTLRGMGGINVAYSTIKTFHGMEIGGGGGVIVNEKLALGLWGSGFFSLEDDIYNKNESNEIAISYTGGYGGIATEYFFKFNSPLNISIPFRFGVGGVAVDSTRKYNYGIIYYNDGSNGDGGAVPSIENSFMFVLQPGLSFNLNATKFLVISADIKWRFSILTHDLKYLSMSDLSQPILGLSFRFGNFGYPSLKL